MTAVEQALQELSARIVEIAPAHEGLRDYERLNIQDATRAEVQAQREEYDTMLAAMQAAVDALNALLALHYPNLEPRPISPEALADIQNQLDTITAARKQFKQLEAVSGKMDISNPQ